MAHDVSPTQHEDTSARTIDACAHLDAAARLIEAGHTDDPFHPNIALAAQVGMLAAAIHPGVQASELPDDPWDAAQHLDHALALLDSLPLEPLMGEGRQWYLQLVELRAAISETGAHGHPSWTPR